MQQEMQNGLNETTDRISSETACNSQFRDYCGMTVIRMYYAPGEHDPPHFHAYYNEYKARFSIDGPELIDGNLPRRQMRLVQAWAELHQEELRADWQLAMNAEEPCRIPPLQ